MRFVRGLEFAAIVSCLLRSPEFKEWSFLRALAPGCSFGMFGSWPRSVIELGVKCLAPMIEVRSIGKVMITDSLHHYQYITQRICLDIRIPIIFFFLLKKTIKCFLFQKISLNINFDSWDASYETYTKVF
jgi:hypothetical protein